MLTTLATIHRFRTGFARGAEGVHVPAQPGDEDALEVGVLHLAGLWRGAVLLSMPVRVCASTYN